MKRGGLKRSMGSVAELGGVGKAGSGGEELVKRGGRHPSWVRGKGCRDVRLGRDGTRTRERALCRAGTK